MHLPPPSGGRAGRLSPHDVKAAPPDSMGAIAIERHGGPEAMALLASPRPVLAASEVLIALHTAVIAASDTAMREGSPANGGTRFPFLSSADGAGIVPPAEAAKAHRRLAAVQVHGKLVLRIH